MSIRDHLWNAAKWKVMKDHLGYTDEEMKAFRENPRNEDVLSKAPALLDKRIVLEVVASQGCNSRHKVGDKLYFDGAGNLLTNRGPKKIFIYALNAAASMIFASNELFYAGVDPNDMRFKRAACFDVGVQCGGWGRIVLELSVQDRKDSGREKKGAATSGIGPRRCSEGGNDESVGDHRFPPEDGELRVDGEGDRRHGAGVGETPHGASRREGYPPLQGVLPVPCRGLSPPG